ncbi:MAG TPA: hypothetical protein VGP04_00920 [Pseudonocardiaceae bacterium]|nr:hypothetical protein [Pseudonocardiaceae bacterium]
MRPDPHRITLSTDERERLTVRGIRIVDAEVARLVVDDDRLSGVELTDGRLVPRTAVFVGPRLVPRDELLTALGCDIGGNGWHFPLGRPGGREDPPEAGSASEAARRRRAALRLQRQLTAALARGWRTNSPYPR